MNKKVVLAFGIAALSCGVATPVLAATDSTEFSVTVNPYLNLTLTSADMSAGNIIHLQLTPSSGGTYGSKSLTATASTNNTYGYTLVMSTPHTYLQSDTININDGTYPRIEAIESRTGGRTAAEFEANAYDDMNKWGISIDNTTSYNPIALSQNLKKVTTPASDSATVINMATVLDLLTSPGSYSTTINFELVANAATGSMEQALIDAGKQKITVGNNKYYRIQDIDGAICNATTDTSGILEVVDARDNTIYHVGKLADNRCWLLDNLALNIADANVKNTMYDSTDPTHNTMTNATNEQLGYLFNGGRDEEDSTTDNLPTAGATSWVTGHSNSIPYVNVLSKDIVPTGYYDDVPEEYFDDIVKDEVINGSWSVGGYYNYCAASAGSYCYGGDGNDYGNPSGNATADICPANWRMPTGGENGEYQTLANTITGGTENYIEDHDDIANIRIAMRLPLSGNYNGYNDNAAGQGAYGYFWSSSYSRLFGMYSMDVDALIGDLSIDLQSFGTSRGDGISMRCIVNNI